MFVLKVVLNVLEAGAHLAGKANVDLKDGMVAMAIALQQGAGDEWNVTLCLGVACYTSIPIASTCNRVLTVCGANGHWRHRSLLRWSGGQERVQQA